MDAVEKEIVKEEKKPYTDFISDIEKICRKLEDLQAWDGLTCATRLKNGLVDLLKDK